MFLPGDDSKGEKGTWTLWTALRAQSADSEDSDANSKPEEQKDGQSAQGAVRFAAADEEIDPLNESRRTSEAGGGVKNEELSPEAHEQIRNLAMSLQKSRLQESRMANFAYETVSMPPSRVCGTFSILLDEADRSSFRSHPEIVRRLELHGAL
jgi:hypothetical protein